MRSVVRARVVESMPARQANDPVAVGVGTLANWAVPIAQRLPQEPVRIALVGRRDVFPEACEPLASRFGVECVEFDEALRHSFDEALHTHDIVEHSASQIKKLCSAHARRRAGVFCLSRKPYSPPRHFVSTTSELHWRVTLAFPLSGKYKYLFPISPFALSWGGGCSEFVQASSEKKVISASNLQ